MPEAGGASTVWKRRQGIMAGLKLDGRGNLVKTRRSHHRRLKTEWGSFEAMTSDSDQSRTLPLHYLFSSTSKYIINFLAVHFKQLPPLDHDRAPLETRIHLACAADSGGRRAMLSRHELDLYHWRAMCEGDVSRQRS